MSWIVAEGYETNRIEFKRELTDDLERKAVGFLNSQEGGFIYFGVGDDGSINGLDDIDGDQLKIVNRLKDNVLPNTLGLFDVIAENHDGKRIIKLIISSGVEKPYYIRKYGMSPNGCYIRIGSGVQPMTTQMIDYMYARRRKVSLNNTVSPRRELTFNQLKIYYEGKGLVLGKQFKRNIDLLTADGEYNYNGYLLADENGTSIKVAKYAGIDKVDLIENEEYGYCCLIKAANLVLEKLTAENRTFAKITPTTRLERKMIDPSALREAVINAYVHTDWSREVPPVVELFADRVTVTSYGGLVDGLSQEDFFNCVSMPRNRVLMRVFKDVGMVEHLGSGLGRILKAYDKTVFKFTPNFMIVTFPFVGGFTMPNDIVNGTVNGTVNQAAPIDRILELINNDDSITVDELAQRLGKSRRTIMREIKKLKDAKILDRIGSDKTGRWEIIG
ncbi:MAG: putative DNA binding domain-containing protein [Gracilibacteraceae bacterium]|jgi:predicted HTH transcriptional regulator|nr:putative DNA binding domain-containing protein [Gracilibacteraceae bacterium]